jgi:digeranylgeranylglycerophospholipid reductase
MSVHIQDQFELIVVGGGPAGSVAAWTAAEKGVKTVLLEKDRDFGIPVRCAEGVGLAGLRNFLEPDPKWVDNKLEKVRFIAPNGTILSINSTEKGAILNRKIFDFELVRRAADAGACIRNRCNAKGMEREDGKLKIKFDHYGKEYTISAPLVIGADGVESRVGRWAGLDTDLPLVDIETCFQYTLHHTSIDPEFCDFYFGNNIAPGGYIWVFPKGERWANVGIGISGDNAKHRSAKEFLDIFVEKHFPGASFLSSVAGSVPSGKVPKNIVAEGVMLVGDAAHQSDPLTGSGIISAMWGGRFAGETAAKALEKGDFSVKILEGYVTAWNKRMGEQHAWNYRLKVGVRKLNDDALNHTAQVLSEIPLEERTLGKIFQTALVNELGVMIDIVKAFLQ